MKRKMKPMLYGAIVALACLVPFSVKAVDIDLSAYDSYYKKTIFPFVVTIPDKVCQSMPYASYPTYSGYTLDFKHGQTTLVFSTHPAPEKKVKATHLKGKIMPALSSSTSAKFTFTGLVNETTNGAIAKASNGNHYPFYFVRHDGVGYSFSVFHAPDKILTLPDAKIIYDIFLSIRVKGNETAKTMAAWNDEAVVEAQKISNQTNYVANIQEETSGIPVFRFPAEITLDLSFYNASKEFCFPFRLSVPEMTQKVKSLESEISVVFPHPFPMEMRITKSKEHSLEKVRDLYAENKIPGFALQGYLVAEPNGFIAKSTDGKYHPIYVHQADGYYYYFHPFDNGSSRMNYEEALNVYYIFKTAQTVTGNLNADGSLRTLDLCSRTAFRTYAFPLTLDVPVSVTMPEMAVSMTNSYFLNVGENYGSSLQIDRTVGLTAAMVLKFIRENAFYAFESSTQTETSGGIVKSKKYGYIPYYVVDDGLYSYLLYYPDYFSKPLSEIVANTMYTIMKTVQVNESKKEMAHYSKDVYTAGTVNAGFYHPYYNNDRWFPFTIDLPADAMLSSGAVRWKNYMLNIEKAGSIEEQPLDEVVKTTKEMVSTDHDFESFAAEDLTGYIVKWKQGFYSVSCFYEFDGDVYEITEAYSMFKYSLTDIKMMYTVMQSLKYTTEEPDSGGK